MRGENKLFLHGLLFIFLHLGQKMLFRCTVLGCFRRRREESQTLGKAPLAGVERAALRAAELPNLLAAGACHCEGQRDRTLQACLQAFAQ